MMAQTAWKMPREGFKLRLNLWTSWVSNIGLSMTGMTNHSSEVLFIGAVISSDGEGVG